MSRELKNKISIDKIINAAFVEFGENEYIKASTNNICKNNDISKGLLFHYFKSKDELFLCCVKKCLDELVSYVSANYKKSDLGLEANLNIYFDVRNKFFKDNPYHKHIFRNIVVNPPNHLSEQINNIKENLRELNKNILSQLLEGLELRDKITEESIIQLVLHFSDYLLINRYWIDEEGCNNELKLFINMLFFGVVKRDGGIK